MLSTPLYQPRRKKIGLTALIDVVFILLLFFMLTSSFSQWRAVDIDMPVASSRLPKVEESQLLLLHADHHLTLHNQDFYLADYRDLSASHLSFLDQERPLVLLTERAVDVAAITELLARLQQMGLQKATLGGLLPEGYPQ